MSQITDPPTPYLGPINSFSPGHMIRIQGLAPANAQRININLQCGSNVNPRDDVALHMSVRLLEGYVARNTLDAGMWGTEQGDGVLRIAPGQRFELLVLSDPSEYKIAINGQHFATFPHRIPPSRITHLAIDGDVKLGMISEEGGAADASHQATAASAQFGHQEVPSAPPPSAPGQQYSGYSGPPQGGYGGYGGPQGGGYGPPPPPPGHQQSIGFRLPTNLPCPTYPRLPYQNQTPSYPPIPPHVAYHPPNPIPTYSKQQEGPPNYYPYQQPYGYPGYPTIGQPNYPGSGNPTTTNNNSASWMSKLPGGAAAMGGMVPMLGKGGKKMKKSHMKKAMKYGLPIAGAGVGAYALSKVVGGHHHHHGHHSRSSSSSSSSSSSNLCKAGLSCEE